MKGKINKIFATTALATALVVGSIIPTFAEEATSSSESTITSTSTNETKVSIGVTTEVANISTVSVTVPTVLTLAVLVDQETPEVYIGGSNTNSGTSGTANESSLTFKNLSTNGEGTGIPVTIDKVTVKVGSTSDWTLIDSEKTTEQVAYDMSVVLTDPNNSESTVELGKKDRLTANQEHDVTLGFTLEAPEETDISTKTGKTTNIPISIEAYGKSESYTAQAEAEAFTVEWVISSGTATSDGEGDEEL